MIPSAIGEPNSIRQEIRSGSVTPAFASAKTGMIRYATHGWSALSRRRRGAVSPPSRGNREREEDARDRGVDAGFRHRGPEDDADGRYGVSGANAAPRSARRARRTRGATTRARAKVEPRGVEESR